MHFSVVENTWVLKKALELKSYCILLDIQKKVLVLTELNLNVVCKGK